VQDVSIRQSFDDLKKEIGLLGQSAIEDYFCGAFISDLDHCLVGNIIYTIYLPDK
jgi:hypothetical protein